MARKKLSEYELDSDVTSPEGGEPLTAVLPDDMVPAEFHNVPTDEMPRVLGHAMFYTIGEMRVHRGTLKDRMEAYDLPGWMVPNKVTPKRAFNRMADQLVDTTADRNVYPVESYEKVQTVEVEARKPTNDAIHLVGKLYVPADSTEDEDGRYKDRTLGVFRYKDGALVPVPKLEAMDELWDVWEKYKALACEEWVVTDDVDVWKEVGKRPNEKKFDVKPDGVKVHETWEDFVNDDDEDDEDEGPFGLFEVMQRSHLGRDLQKMMQRFTTHWTKSVKLRDGGAVYFTPARHSETVEKMKLLISEMGELFKHRGQDAELNRIPVLNNEEMNYMVEQRAQLAVRDRVEDAMEEYFDALEDREDELVSEISGVLRDALEGVEDLEDEYNTLLQAEISARSVVEEWLNSMPEGEEKEAAEEAVEEVFEE